MKRSFIGAILTYAMYSAFFTCDDYLLDYLCWNTLLLSFKSHHYMDMSCNGYFNAQFCMPTVISTPTSARLSRLPTGSTPVHSLTFASCTGRGDDPAQL